MVKTRAAVQTGDRTIELQEFEVPGSIGGREALLAVEASGMCGSDWEQYQGEFAETGLVEYPCIPGHEPIGRIGNVLTELGVEIETEAPLEEEHVHPHHAYGPDEDAMGPGTDFMTVPGTSDSRPSGS